MHRCITLLVDHSAVILLNCCSHWSLQGISVSQWWHMCRESERPHVSVYNAILRHAVQKKWLVPRFGALGSYGAYSVRSPARHPVGLLPTSPAATLLCSTLLYLRSTPYLFRLIFSANRLYFSASVMIAFLRLITNTSNSRLHYYLTQSL